MNAMHGKYEFSRLYEERLVFFDTLMMADMPDIIKEVGDMEQTINKTEAIC